MTVIANIANPFPQDSELYFRTVERPLQASLRFGKTAPIGTHKAVVRQHPDNPDQPSVIGVVGKNYSVVNNKPLMQAVEHSFQRELNASQLRGVQVNDHISRGGALCYREYHFPNLACAIETKHHRTDVGFRAIVLNAFDGSKPIKLMSGAIDFFCTNGIISGEYDMFGRKHTGDIEAQLEANWDHNIFSRQIAKSLERFTKETKRMQQWAEIELSHAQAFDLFRNLPNISERKAKNLHDHFRFHEAPKRGMNAWAVVSAMTFYASHTDASLFRTRNTGNDNNDEIVVERQQEVRQWLNSRQFTEALAA